MYKCECGKEFDSRQSFCGHCSMCKIHLGDDKFKKRQIISSNSMKASNDKRKLKRDEFIDKWISEGHKCKNCGKVMINYYGSGRFCSRSCSNSYSARINNDKRRLSLSEATIRSIENGRHNGIPSRKPYIEKYWNYMLSRYNIKLEPQFKVMKNSGGYYLMDFLVEDIVDLEIDGPYHSMESDNIRDNFMKSRGYIVYRVNYINPHKERDKIINQIDNFISFLRGVISKDITSLV